MNYEIIVKPTFQREAKRLAKHYSSFKEDFVSLIDDLEQNPLLGTDLGHGLRKVRMKITSKGKGKSGGARVITFTLVVSQQDAVLNLLYIYDKADRASISEKEIEQLLTQTEKNILKEIALGKTTKEIAAEKNLSFHTINSHRKNIFRKLGVNNVHEATKYAMRAGIVDLAEYYI